MNRPPSIRMKKTASIASASGCLHQKESSNNNILLYQVNMKAFFFLLVFLVSLVKILPGQTVSENNLVQQKHSPRKASIYSAVLPGLGQAYNRKYWKIPIIYGGFGAIYYITNENNREYRKFLEAYRYVVNQDTFAINNDYVGRYNEQQLLSGKNYYRRNLEIGYILAGVLYVLNIIDASVDAHLFYYDVSENLTMRLEPAVLNDPMAAKPIGGLSLTFRF